MSPPWAPAFIRTAPPRVPGTAQAQAKPRNPASATARPAVGNGSAAPARTAVVARSARDLDTPEPATELMATPGHPCRHEQVGASTDDQPRHVVLTADPSHRTEVGVPLRGHQRPRGPPTRRVVSAARECIGNDRTPAPALA
jgi:hypothetical protein